MLEKMASNKGMKQRCWKGRYRPMNPNSQMETMDYRTLLANYWNKAIEQGFAAAGMAARNHTDYRENAGMPDQVLN